MFERDILWLKSVAELMRFIKVFWRLQVAVLENVQGFLMV